jgi:hypothetical protein
VDPLELGAEDEVVLMGGNTHARIVRIGETVRRPTCEWTPGVHSLLQHLESEGFTGAPRVLGIDDEGREVLTFVTGDVVDPDHLDLIESDDALESVGSFIRGYHEAIASFDMGQGRYRWCDWGADPSGTNEVLCHNDLAPWNLVRSPKGWVFIDWDLAAPGRRSWDLAYALHTLVPLWPTSGLSDDVVVRRIRRFCSGYRMPDLGPELIDGAIERCTTMYELIRKRAAHGEGHFTRLLADGHDEIWEAGSQHVAQNAATWKQLLAIGG